MKVLIFDTETTGLPKTKIISPDTLDLWPYIVQISYIIYDTSINIITDDYNHIIRIPETISISNQSSSIHGITDEISRKKGVHINEILLDFFYNLKNVDMVVGHNVEFDINIVRVELLRLICEKNIPHKELNSQKHNLYFITNLQNVFCTMRESVEFCNIQATDKSGKPYLKFPKLTELHQKLFNSTPNNLHNSMVDILVTLRCFIKMKYDMDILTNCRRFKRFVIQYSIY
jgi:DNA polymerase III epsilon subunit-like protein